MSNFITEFLEAMRAAGFEPKGKFTADDKWHQAYYMDERGAKASGTYSMKIVSDDFAIGCFFTRKDPDNKHKWHSNSGEKLSPEERKRINKQIKEQQRQQEIEEEARQKKISRRLSRFYKNLPKEKDLKHPYLSKKGVSANGIKRRKKRNELIVPLYGADGKIWTIQRITTKGGKYLFAGGKKQGGYFPMCSSKEDLKVMLITEGFATGASIRQATRYPVIVAIDSGNLKPVLVSLKAKYPDTKFVICADNDAFTVIADEPCNVGEKAAHEAAQAIGGAYVVSPSFASLDPAAYEEQKPTDFNDLHAITGLDEVKAQIEEVINKIPEPETVKGDAAGDESLQLSDQHTGGIEHLEAPPPMEYDERDYEAEAANIDPLEGDFGMNYKVLGYNKGTYYYFPFKERQIVALTASQHSLQNLFRLDNLDNWMNQFGAAETSEKKVTMYATNALMELAKHRGVFKEEDRVRGCGAWTDEGRKILHCGDVLYVDGIATKFDQIESEFTYIAAAKLIRPEPTPLGSREAFALRQICESITWENKLSGSLLAGWLVVAPICGALSFRPHIYVTGEAESGKSTVLNKIIKPVLGKISINADGGTTEPAIREMTEHDARPLVYDEAEKSPAMGAVIELARKASSGSMVKKFGQGMMKARFCACFSAINPPVNKTADESRISFMTIKKNRRPTAIEEYNELLDRIEATITPDYSGRLIARTLESMDNLFENIKIFQKAARLVVKSARASELIGTMLAGLYLLSKTDIVSPEFAEEWIAQHDWSDHTMIEDDTDPVRLLQYLSGCLLRMSFGGTMKEFSVGDLIIMAYKENDAAADKVLRYHGIAVKDKKVHIASRSQHLEKLLRDTDWSMKWTRMLSNIDGAENFKIFYFGVGLKTSGVSLPIKIFTDKEEATRPAEYVRQDTFEEIPF